MRRSPYSVASHESHDRPQSLAMISGLVSYPRIQDAPPRIVRPRRTNAPVNLGGDRGFGWLRGRASGLGVTRSRANLVLHAEAARRHVLSAGAPLPRSSAARLLVPAAHQGDAAPRTTRDSSGRDEAKDEQLRLGIWEWHGDQRDEGRCDERSWKSSGHGTNGPRDDVEPGSSGDHALDPCATHSLARMAPSAVTMLPATGSQVHRLGCHRGESRGDLLRDAR